MNLFLEYQTLARSPTSQPRDLERMAEIVEIASLTDEELLTAIFNLEFLMAQEAGFLSEGNIFEYQEQQNKLLQYVKENNSIECSCTVFFSTQAKA